MTFIVASGVTSRTLTPVPPVVRIKSFWQRSLKLINCETISFSSSAITVTPVTLYPCSDIIFSINGPLSSFLCPILALSLNVNTATRILESLFSMTSTVSPTQM